MHIYVKRGSGGGGQCPQSIRLKWLLNKVLRENNKCGSWGVGGDYLVCMIVRQNENVKAFKHVLIDLICNIWPQNVIYIDHILNNWILGQEIGVKDE